MRFLRSIKGWLADVMEPAEDPRAAYPASAGSRRDVIGEVQTARRGLAASRGQLEEKVTDARAKLATMSASGIADPVVRQLQTIVEAELEALEGEIEALRAEERELEVAEQRLAAQADAISVREHALRAVQAAEQARARIRQEIADLPTDIAGVGDVLEAVGREAPSAQGRGTLLDRFAALGISGGRYTFASAEAEEIARRYASASAREGSERTRTQLGNGFRALLDIETEYRQLRDVLGKRRETDPMSVAYIPPLADETYQQGLSVLRDAVDLVEAIRSPSEEELRAAIERAESGDVTPSEPGNDLRKRIAEDSLASLRKRLELVERNRGRVDELVHLGERCATALGDTRLELAALQAAGAGTSVNAVTEALKANLDQAREVQEELKRLGL